MIGRVLAWGGATLVAGALGFAILAWRPAIAPAAVPDRASFPAEEVRRGAVLASAGFCATCHTRDGGGYNGGGKPVATPFGTIYGSNITPDPETGIGAWTRAAFDRSMRDGVSRDGRHLYPAFPYTHFVGLTEADLGALYAFTMTRDPVRAETPAPELPFPLTVRPLLAGWKLLFGRSPAGRSPAPSADPARGEAWNRGRYLAEALAHCGACHTPRNVLGAEIASRVYEGGEADDWWSPPLHPSSPAPLAWSEESLFNYLRSWDERHGGGEGPMKPVVAGLSRLPEADLRALAIYTKSLYGPERASDPPRSQAILARSGPVRRSAAVDRGELVYRGACANCHESGAAVPFTVRSLGQHTSVAGPDPRNLLHAVLNGLHPVDGAVGAIMPAFRDVLSEGELVDLLAYSRARFTDEPDWPDAAAQVRRLSARGGSASPKGGTP